MKAYIVKVLETDFVANNVKRFAVDRELLKQIHQACYTLLLCICSEKI